LTKLAFILTELFRNLYRNPGTAIASLLSLALLFLLFDLFWIAAGTSDKFYGNLLSNLQMQVYVEEWLSDKDAKALETLMKEIKGIADAQYVSRETARSELAAIVGVDLLVGYDDVNPLPRSYVILFEPTHLQIAAIDSVESRLKRLSGVGKIDYSRQWLEKAESTRKIIKNAGMILGALILFTTLVSLANNIRLMTRTRAVGFWQMRLLGAGRVFIALPFLLEGFLIGAWSAVLSWLIMLYSQDKVSFTQFELVMPTLSQVTWFCLAAGVLGVLSGLLGIRKMMR